MKFTLSWLKDHLETTASLNEIAQSLTALGLEVESITDPAATLKDFVVAEIKDAQPHPNASKLQTCQVNDGSETRQIVCGAPNARKGLKTVLAREGVFIPGSGITIKKTKIRDVESNGMLCSAEELGLNEASEGILELPADARPGSPAAAALGLNDAVIDIAITPNRADCLGVYGIARDLAAAGIGSLKGIQDSGFRIREENEASPESRILNPESLTISTPYCPLFTLHRIRGVKNHASPAWLQARLKAVGLRPISAIVDITNYVMLSYGQPLHAYDAAKLTGGISVREAQPGQQLAALDGKQYALNAGMLVIADESGPLGLGGIIGGAKSGCDENTTEILLESALFDPVSIARTGRALEINTDARYRFERGTDPAFAETAARLAAALILEICGGEIVGVGIAGKAPESTRILPFRPARVESLGGLAVAESQCTSILNQLGCTIDASDATAWKVTPASWRRDIEGEADLVEEILRVVGYDSIPATPLPKLPRTNPPALSPKQKRERAARHTLVARGMLEVQSWSFLAEETAKLFGWSDEKLKLINPISADLNVMRPSLLPNLLTAAANNRNRGLADVQLFEVGATFKGIAPDQQQTAAAGIRAGSAYNNDYHNARFMRVPYDHDAFAAKTDALALLSALGVNTAPLGIAPAAPGWYHPGRSGAIAQGKTILGYFGEIHPVILPHFELEGRIAAFEIFLDAIPLPRAKSKAKPPLALSPYQAVDRDFAFTVDAALPAAELTRALAAAEKQLITGIALFDVYTGKGVEEGKKSIALRITLQAMDRTLTDAEITAVSDTVIKAAAALGAQLRQ